MKGRLNIPCKSALALLGALVLPALFLAFFCLISIRNQRQNLDQELTRRADTVGLGIQEQVNLIFQRLESALDSAMPVFDQNSSGNAALAELLRQNPLSCVCLFGTNNALKAPIIPWERFPGPEKRPAEYAVEFRDAFSRAEAEEVQGRLEDAVGRYRKLSAVSANANERALVLNALGRAHRKMGKVADAVSDYGRLLADTPQAITPNGGSLGAIACMESADLDFQAGNSSNAIRSCAVLLRGLLSGGLPCGRDECMFYYERVKNLVNDLPTNETAECKNQLHLLNNVLVAASWKDRIESRSPQAAISGKYVYRADGSGIFGFGKTGSMPHETVVFSIDAEKLKANILAEVANSLKYAEAFDYEIRDAAQRPFLASPSGRLMPPIVRQSLTNRLKGWELSVSIRETEALKFGARLRMLTMGGFVVLLLAVMAAGAYFMISLMRRQAELSAMKSDFVSSVSHEMRTPLTTIRMIAEMFQLGRVKDNMAGEYIETIAGETGRLTRLINKVLDFSRMDSGRKPYVFELRDIGPLVSSTVRAIDAGVKAEGYRINLNIESNLPQARVDEDAMSEVLLNLLDNAVKYSPVDKNISVSVFKTGKNLVVEVTDHGISIEREKLDKIFEKFYRGEDELTRKTTGTGIGLAIVKHIVEAHHGRIEVRSARGKGSVFSVILPV